MGGDARGPYASRAGVKLEAALRAFELDVAGLCCADFGCHAGGFTDCLLQAGAAKVYAIDTGYGVLDYRLRRDPRVVVLERTNVLHRAPPEPVALVTVDVAWTPQRLAIPAALRWLKPTGRIVTLVKPHYERCDEDDAPLREGTLEPAGARRVLARVLAAFPGFGATPLAVVRSPVRGAKSARRRRGGGNVEYLVLAQPATLGGG